MDMCRDHEYYVDVLSDKVVELGTLEYPYKDIETVFIEILNLHSNQQRDITVNVKEGTWNYLHLRRSYLINLGKVAIKSYSESGQSNNRATIVGTDNANKKNIYVVSTMFNVLQNPQLPVAQKLRDYGGIDESQITYIVNENNIFHVVKTILTFEGINFYTEHLNELKGYFFFKLTNIKYYLFKVSQSLINISGVFLQSDNQASLTFEDIEMDFYRTERFVNVYEF